MARVARKRWGLEAVVLGMTRSAITITLIQFGLIVTVSCMPLGLVAGMDIHVVRTAGRRIGEMDGATRIEASHFQASTQSCRNLYITHYAGLMHPMLGAYQYSAGTRLSKELAAILGPSARELARVGMEPLPEH